MAKRKQKKKTSKKSINIRHWLTQKLRRISFAWPPRKEAIKKARISRGKYKCASCEGVFGPKQIQLDHIIPVIDPHVGWVDYNTFIERLLCEESNYQVLCKSCHDWKTTREDLIRTQTKSLQKVEDDDV